MKCTFVASEREGVVVCTRCGQKAYSENPERVDATCKVRGLGDRIADCLAFFGITKQRYQRWRGKPCGCLKRQEALNRWGEQLLGRRTH